jgi:uncharacterized NAD(P)/FAD-binding protein YdhS
LSRQHTVAIVGAGLSGTLVAANLLKSQHRSATRIVLIERAAKMARGKAYADREHPYLLNVPAGRMSADSARPLDFLSFAQKRIPQATAEDFLPRSLYGEYLEATLLHAEGSASPYLTFERLRGDVCAIEKRGNAFGIRLADGRSVLADDVVLATGNPPPSVLPGTEALLDSGECYIPDPWAAPITFRRGEEVLLVGSGLTMVDVATAAAAAVGEKIVIHAISRHGLVPSSQTAFSHSTCKGDSAAMLRAASFSALRLMRSVRELADETERRGGDWREAVTYIRNIAPALWQRLPAREKRRMLRHVRPYWDVHRHRLPSETLAKLALLRRRRKLSFHAGRLEKFERIGDKVRVTWRSRGDHEPQTLLVDRVINCTGPNYNVSRSQEPLLHSLLSQGLATADPLGLGIRTGTCGAVIDAAGRPATNLFYVGPMLRADHWEATAAQELRVHAESLASHLARQLAEIAPPPVPSRQKPRFLPAAKRNAAPNFR